MNWLHSVLLGFFGGLCQMLPMSDGAARGLLRQILGASSEGPLFMLLYRAAILTVLLSSGFLELHKLRRTARILRMPYRRRTGNPSLNESGTLRLLRLPVVLALVGGVLSVRLDGVADRLWLVSIPLILGGFLLWLPTHMPGANKDGRHLTGLDGMLMGLGAMAAAVPGISPMGSVFAIASLLGAHRSYALRIGSILLASRLAGSMFMDVLSLGFSGFTMNAQQLISAGLGAAAAAAGTYFAVQALRYLTRSGPGALFGFCYYNWGQALLSLLLFLTI